LVDEKPQAARRTNEQKSKLAATVLRIVKAMFDTVEYRGQPEKICAYCLWAFKMGALYATLTPMGSKAKSGDIRYIVRFSLHGLLVSLF